MGSQVIAMCPCGLYAEILIGGGMMDFETTCYYPAVCEHCHRLVQIDVLEDGPECPECGATDPIPYDDPRLQARPGGHVAEEWRPGDAACGRVVLTEGEYRCPACGQMTLTFTDSGLVWD